MGKILDFLYNRKQESQIKEVDISESNSEKSFYSDDPIHFYKLDADVWYSKVPKKVFSHRDFNFHESFLDYLDSTDYGMGTTFYSSYKHNYTQALNVICELTLFLEEPKASDYHFNFVKESNTNFLIKGSGSFGIDHLVNSLKYVILNDDNLKDKSVQFNSATIYFPKNRESDLKDLENKIIEDETSLNSLNHK